MKICGIFATTKLSGEAFLIYKYKAEAGETFEVKLGQEFRHIAVGWFPGHTRLREPANIEIKDNIATITQHEDGNEGVFGLVSTSTDNEIITIPDTDDVMIYCFDNTRFDSCPYNEYRIMIQLEFICKKFLDRSCIPGELSIFPGKGTTQIGMSMAEKRLVAKTVGDSIVNRYVQVYNTIIAVITKTPQIEDAFGLYKNVSFGVFSDLKSGDPYLLLINDAKREVIKHYPLRVNDGPRLYICHDRLEGLSEPKYQ